jgi:hypothetical protein
VDPGAPNGRNRVGHGLRAFGVVRGVGHPEQHARDVVALPPGEGRGLGEGLIGGLGLVAPPSEPCASSDAWKSAALSVKSKGRVT